MRANFHTSSQYRAIVDADEATLAALEHLIYPIFQRVNTFAPGVSPHLEVVCTPGLTAEWRTELQTGTWNEYKEGFERTVRIKQKQVNQSTTVHQHEAGDLLVTQRQHDCTKITVCSPNAAHVARYVLLDCVAKWLRSSGGRCMHASAVSVQGQAVIICGHKRAGKTTLALELTKLGAEIAYLENDRTLWHSNTVYSGGTSMNLQRGETKVKARGKDALAFLPPGVPWKASGPLGTLIVLESGHSSITITEIKGDPAVALLEAHEHDPWSNWLGVYDLPSKSPLQPEDPVLLCQHGTRDEAAVAIKLLNYLQGNSC